MVMNKFEAAASVKTNNTATQCLPYSSQFTSDLTRLMGSYMDDADLEKFSNVDLNFFPPQACQEDIDNRKFVRAKILPHVFNADPDALAAFLKQSGSTPMPIPRMLLTKAGFNEGYESSALNIFICFRSYRGVSALTAAAYSGDEFFVVIQLLAHLIHEDNHRLEALQQLEEVEKRITKQTIREYNTLVVAANALLAIEFGTDYNIKEAAKKRLEELTQSAEFQLLIEDPSIVEEAIAAGFTPHKDKAKSSVTNAQDASASDQKALSESKAKAENAPFEYADDADFLTPVLRLLKAYINFLIKYSKLYEKSDWEALDHLWEIEGECHKRLFRNVLQEYFDPEKTFSSESPVDFNREPKRAPCVYSNRVPLQLDNIGCSTMYGLYKFGARVMCGSRRLGVRRLAVENLGAFTPYYKLRTTGLKNIIEQLKTPSSAAALVAAYVNNSQAAKKS